MLELSKGDNSFTGTNEGFDTKYRIIRKNKIRVNFYFKWVSNLQERLK